MAQGADYILVVHQAEEGGFWAEVPALPGCFGQGETMDDVIADCRAAIESHIDALRAEGQPIPDEQISVVSVRLGETA